MKEKAIQATLLWAITACLIPSRIECQEQILFPAAISNLVEKHCTDCHNDETAEGNIRLDNLAKLELPIQLDLLNKVQEQVFFKLMPPEDATSLGDKQRERLNKWISQELRQRNSAGLDEKLKRPEYGNFLDHEKLFSGDYAGLPGFTYDRRWLISEHIFNAKINQLLNYNGVRTVDGHRQNVIGDNGVGLGTRFGGGTLRQSIVNPFLLPKTIGIRYYDQTSLTRGHLLTMIGNAKKIAAYITTESTLKAHYPFMYQMMRTEFKRREILDTRRQFLQEHISQIGAELYGEKNESLFPGFVRVSVDAPSIPLDNKGNPRRKESNLGLLDRYDAGDMKAIYLGISKHQNQNKSFDEVIEKCERDWFVYGISQARIRERVGIMKSLNTLWDMDLIYDDIRKKNFQPAKYQPLPEKEMQVVKRAIRKNRKAGDNWVQVIEKCMKEWQRLPADDQNHAPRDKNQPASQTLHSKIIEEVYAKIFLRQPTATELKDNLALLQKYLAKLKPQAALAKLVESLILNSEFVYRSEFGTGQPDVYGRKRLSQRDMSYALSYAITDSAPDEELVKAAEENRLLTREDYRREIRRMLSRRDQFYVIDESVQKAGFNSSITNLPIRKLRFFREFFGYTQALTIFKDDARFGAGSYDNVKGRLVDEADMLVAHILEQDQDVFEKLLTTQNFYVFHSGDNQEMKAASDRLRTIYDYFRKFDWQNFNEEELYEHWPFIHKMKMRGTVFPDFQTNEKRKKGWVRSFKRTMESLELRFANGQKNAIPYDELPMAYWHKGNATGRTGQVMRGHEVTTFFNIDYQDWDYPTTQPAAIQHRRGLLTHPAWLIAHAQNTETDPVRRGKWIREKLLAGTIPDVPITVDAVIPEDHHKTLRQRLEKRTSDSYCWQCHQKMDPLGLPFEQFDDFGRYRTRESIEHPENLIKAVDRRAPAKNGIRVAEYKSLPVDPRGELLGTESEELDGQVNDAFDLIDRLGRSQKVRQSIIRHAFRFFLGRNETLSDSKTLIEAENAYVKSGGSFDAVIASLLTSDSFIYRKSRSPTVR